MRRSQDHAEKRLGCRLFIVCALLLHMANLCPLPAHAIESKQILSLDVEDRWTGDYDEMVKRRSIRVLVPYSKTYFFVDGDRLHGLAVELLREFEKFLHGGAKSRNNRMNIVLVPTRRDQIIPALRDGQGDIAVANLTVTEARRKLVEFSSPFRRNVREVVVTPKGSGELASPTALSGKTVHVRKSSSYFDSLTVLNKTLRHQNKEPVRIVLTNENLEDEDLLEMVNAELIDAIVIDSHKAAFWMQIFGNLKVHQQAEIREGADVAWAFRKNSPKLKSKINSFIKTAAQGATLGNILLKRYYKSVDWLKKANSEATARRLGRLERYFKKYGAMYRIDWLILAGLAFKESRFQQSAVGPTGAVGIMQIKPSTAAGKEVQVRHVEEDVEANIHAGAKYLRYLADRYFAGDEVDEFNQVLFALASYNAGPNRIARIRRYSADPNVWFDNVEDVVARRVNLIPVRYVLSILQYYVSFKNYRDGLLGRHQARETLTTQD